MFATLVGAIGLASTAAAAAASGGPSITMGISAVPRPEFVSPTLPSESDELLDDDEDDELEDDEELEDDSLSLEESSPFSESRNSMSSSFV
jgi:hypothetical protein